MEYRVCAYAVCQDEATFVERWMGSMGNADEMVSVNTGSSDNMVALLRQGGVQVYDECVASWRFDTLRNASLNRVPEDVDILLEKTPF
jgi:hypothetical protein